MATSFTINAETNVVSVVDFVQRKSIDYSLDSYNFISEKSLDYYSTCFEYVNGKQRLAYKSRGLVHAYAQYNSTIYTFRDRIMDPAYNIGFGKFKLPPRDHLIKLLDKDKGFKSTLHESDYISHYEIFETGNILNTYYSVSQKNYFGLYNKRTGETYSFSKQYFEDKMKVGTMNKPSGRINDYVVAVLKPSDLRTRFNDGYNLNNELEKLLSSESDNNPILFLYKFKS